MTKDGEAETLCWVAPEEDPVRVRDHAARRAWRASCGESAPAHRAALRWRGEGVRPSWCPRAVCTNQCDIDTPVQAPAVGVGIGRDIAAQCPGIDVDRYTR